MLKSKLTKPCFYIKSKADITELMAIRGKLSKASGVKITSNAFLIRALALAVDRRVADEVYVVRFLNSIAEQLQNLRELV
jgi:pyruvate/2-oxoglutarate dehydrogenase complex dihydrolipoamide acyltransferase (E2) component